MTEYYQMKTCFIAIAISAFFCSCASLPQNKSLTTENIKKVKIGLSRDSVYSLFGEPDYNGGNQIVFGNEKFIRSYSILYIEFDNNKVVNLMAKVKHPCGDERALYYILCIDDDTLYAEGKNFEKYFY